MEITTIAIFVASITIAAILAVNYILKSSKKIKETIIDQVIEEPIIEKKPRKPRTPKLEGVAKPIVEKKPRKPRTPNLEGVAKPIVEKKPRKSKV